MRDASFVERSVSNPSVSSQKQRHLYERVDSPVLHVTNRLVIPALDEGHTFQTWEAFHHRIKRQVNVFSVSFRAVRIHLASRRSSCWW